MKYNQHVTIILGHIPFKRTFGRVPLPKSTPIWKGTLLICISMNKTNSKKFLHWKLLDNICSSELKQNHRAKSSACEFENFSSSTFPLFSYFWTTNEIFWEKMLSDLSSSAKKSVKYLKRTSCRWLEEFFW